MTCPPSGTRRCGRPRWVATPGWLATRPRCSASTRSRPCPTAELPTAAAIAAWRRTEANDADPEWNPDREGGAAGAAPLPDGRGSIDDARRVHRRAAVRGGLAAELRGP